MKLVLKNGEFDTEDVIDFKYGKVMAANGCGDYFISIDTRDAVVKLNYPEWHSWFKDCLELIHFMYQKKQIEICDSCLMIKGFRIYVN